MMMINISLVFMVMMMLMMILMVVIMVVMVNVDDVVIWVESYVDVEGEIKRIKGCDDENRFVDVFKYSICVGDGGDDDDMMMMVMMMMMNFMMGIMFLSYRNHVV